MENKEKKPKKSVRKKRIVRVKGKTSIRTLTKKIAELNKILSCISIPISKTSVKYLSDLYPKTLKLVMDITAYMVQEKYCGMHNTIDNSIIKAQELVGILKEFKTLNESNDNLKLLDDDFQAKSSSLLQALKVKMGELLTLRASTVE